MEMTCVPLSSVPSLISVMAVQHTHTHTHTHTNTHTHTHTHTDTHTHTHTRSHTHTHTHTDTHTDQCCSWLCRHIAAPGQRSCMGHPTGARARGRTIWQPGASLWQQSGTGKRGEEGEGEGGV